MSPLDPLDVPPGSLSLAAATVISDAIDSASTPPGGSDGDLQFDNAGQFGNAGSLNSGDIANAIGGNLLLNFANGVEIGGDAAGDNSFSVNGVTGISLEANNASAGAVDISGKNLSVSASNGMTFNGGPNGITFNATNLGGGGPIDFASTAGITIGSGSDTLAFYGAATPVAKPTITGSKGGNVALASLLTHLAALGLVTDSTT